MKIRGSSILVTGASRGIGAATAIAAAQRGAREVILLARSEADLEAIENRVRAEGAAARVYPVDLSSREAVHVTAERIRDEGGVPDILVNNAGLGRWLFLDETSSDEADMMVRVPFLASYYLTHAFIGDFVKRGSGHILMVNSPASLTSWPGATGYAISRWGQRGIAEALYADLAETNIGVTHFVAGEVESNYFAANPHSRERLPKVAALIPAMSTQTVAVRLLDAIERNRRQAIEPFMLRVFHVGMWLTPGLVRWLVRKTGYRR